MTSDTWVALAAQLIPTVVGVGALVLAHFHVRTNAQTQADALKTMTDLVDATHGKFVNHADQLLTDVRSLVSDVRAANQPAPPPTPQATPAQGT